MTHYENFKALNKIEQRTWRAKSKGLGADICTTLGQVGKLEQAWRDAADAMYEYRRANGLIGLTWKQLKDKSK